MMKKKRKSYSQIYREWLKVCTSKMKVYQWPKQKNVYVPKGFDHPSALDSSDNQKAKRQLK